MSILSNVIRLLIHKCHVYFGQKLILQNFADISRNSIFLELSNHLLTYELGAIGYDTCSATAELYRYHFV
jgi:hypothetical protein